MSEELADEQSHYEISLTASQAFVAFVLLLLSMAASFAFGLTIGKGQGGDDRLVVRKDPSVVSEASMIPRKASGKIVELGVGDEDFAKAAEKPVTPADSSPLVTGGTETPAPAAIDPGATPVPATAAPADPPGTSAAVVETHPEAVPHAVESHPVAPVVQPRPAELRSAAVPRWGVVYAQLLSTGDQKTAEAMAAKVINSGFTSAYVERGSTPKGPVFRVRVKFDSDTDARVAEPRLREFSKDVWITK